MRFIPLFSEIALEPLHDLRQRDAWAWFDKEMDVVAQHREVPKLEEELLFGGENHSEKGLLDVRGLQGHRVVVDFRGYMIGGSGLEVS
jgi:hypothetical protein